jgi:hypothetical protein
MAAFPSQPAYPPALWLAAPAVLGGLLAGLLVAADAELTHVWLSPLRASEWLRVVPYTATIAGVALAAAALALVAARERVWRARTVAAIGFVMFCSHLGAVGGGVLNPLVAAIGLLFALWLLERLATPLAPWQPTMFAALAWLLMAAVLASVIGHHPREVFGGLFSFIPKFMLMLMLVDLIRDRGSASAAVNLLLGFAALFAVVGIAQVGIYLLTGREYALSDELFRYAQTPFGHTLRASGLARTANQYAPPLAAACVLALGLLWTAAGRGRRLLLAAVFVLSATAVMLSVVRGCWLAIAVGVCALPFIIRPAWSFYWAGIGLVAAAAALASGLVQFVVQAVVGLSEAGATERWELLIEGLRAMLTHWNGVGIHNFGPYSPSFERYPVHNAFGQVASELGVFGLAAMLALVGYVAWHLVVAIRAAGSDADRGFAGAVLGGLVTLVAATQSEPMGYSQFLLIYLALCEGCARAVRCAAHEV